jgi:hypothetical protein
MIYTYVIFIHIISMLYIFVYMFIHTIHVCITCMYIQVQMDCLNECYIPCIYHTDVYICMYLKVQLECLNDIYHTYMYNMYVHTIHICINVCTFKYSWTA